MQTVPVLRAGELRLVELPAPTDEVVPGVLWGSADSALTPAYWAVRCHAEPELLHGFLSGDLSLRQEVGFCLLGGFGVKAEVAMAFFNLLDEHDVFTPHFCPDEDDIRLLLERRISIGTSQSRYRFPIQRAHRIALAMQAFDREDFGCLASQELREKLATLKGIGPKTASWIVRNWLGADDLAILDIHVVRACQWIGLFSENVRLPHDYDCLEAAFLSFSAGLGVRASILDAVMWSDMRTFPPSTLKPLDSN